MGFSSSYRAAFAGVLLAVMPAYLTDIIRPEIVMILVLVAIASGTTLVGIALRGREEWGQSATIVQKHQHPVVSGAS